MLHNPTYPQPSLEGGGYKPSNAGAAPIVNSVDGRGPAGGGRNTTVLPDMQRQEPVSTDWLSMARNAYDSSEQWLQTNVRATFARNFAHYRSEHAPGSPINDPSNRHRPNYFWPKTRTLVRAIQAAMATAYFSSSDVVVMDAVDADSVSQVAVARFMKALVNYRLTTTIPWYKLVLGAGAEAAVLGTVISHQSWDYRTEKRKVGEVQDVEGNVVIPIYEDVPVVDEPKIRIVPVENIRISPAADWTDRANSSPYLIELMPMFLGDVLDRIANGDSSKTGEPAWKDIGVSALMSAGTRDNLDSTRRARSGKDRLDPKSNMMEAEDVFRVIWIHRNIIRHNGVDYLYYTAGTTHMLSDPVPLRDVIPWAKGKRDYVIGEMEIETDRPYPSSPTDMVSGLQRAFNELKNSRLENVRQVLNRRYLYRQGNQVDVRALSRNVPGGLIGVMGAGNLENHVQPLPVQDVTSSSFQEEDRLGLAIDDLTGSSTGSTVVNNRKLQETATGMNIMAESGNAIREMELRTITESWMEGALRQLVQLIAMYETDETAMTVAAKEAGLLKVLPEYFDYTFSVSVNVGMGATSPTQRMNKLQTAVQTTMNLIPDAQTAVNGAELSKEIFSVAGYDNGERFFDFVAGAQKQQAMAQQDTPQTALAREQMQAKMEVEQAKLQLQQMKLEMDKQKLETDLAKALKEIDLLTAQTTTENVAAIYSAVQATATIAQDPAMAPATDAMLKSAGFQDHDPAPIVTAPPPMTPAAPEILAPQVEVPKNTHPQFPASPKKGIMRGIETPQIEQQI